MTLYRKTRIRNEDGYYFNEIKATIYGIVSWGVSARSRVRGPSVFTRVPAIMDWIGITTGVVGDQEIEMGVIAKRESIVMTARSNASSR